MGRRGRDGMVVRSTTICDTVCQSTKSSKEVMIYHVILHWPVDIDRLKKWKWRPINPVSIEIWNSIQLYLKKKIIFTEPVVIHWVGYDVLWSTSYCTKWSAVIVLLHLTFPFFFVYPDQFLGIVLAIGEIPEKLKNLLAKRFLRPLQCHTNTIRKWYRSFTNESGMQI
jgi:hypothetical protein